MAIVVLPDLIDKQDNFEIVRDQIAGILELNTVEQMSLATAALKDPALWDLSVFVERTNPYEQYRGQAGTPAPTNTAPIVSVWYEAGTFEEASSNVGKQQTHLASINIDIYGYGIPKDDGAGGQIPGDLLASQNAQRAVRLVRNILMAEQNTYLQLRGLVWQRWPESITAFQPEFDGQPAAVVLGYRFPLRCKFSENSPEIATPDNLEIIDIDIMRQSDGLLVAEARYDVVP